MRTKSHRTVSLAAISALSVLLWPAAASADDWGAEREGLKTRLVSVTQEYLIGQAIPIRLDLTNPTSTPQDHACQVPHITMYLEVNGPGGPVRYVGPGLQQIMYQIGTVAPGELVTLWETPDLGKLYQLGRPGRYTVRFRGSSGCPPSNAVGIQVGFNLLQGLQDHAQKVEQEIQSASDIVMKRLVEVLSEPWQIQKTTTTAEERQGAIRFLLTYSAGNQRPIEVSIWIPRSMTLATVPGTWAVGGFRYHHRGRSGWGEVYTYVPSEAEVIWPTVHEDIARALEITSN